MTTIAIPIFENRISNRLDCSENILFISIENGVVKKRQTFHWALAKPLEKINSLIHLGVNVLICDGITEFYSSQLKNTPIQVIPWVSGEVDDVLAQYLEGKLSANQTLTSKGE